MGLLMPVGTTGALLGEFYDKTLALGALAGLAGLPQVQFPLGPSFKYAGMSLIGARGTDLALIRLAHKIAANF